METVMYLIVNKGLEMSPGKLAAQVAHGAIHSAIISETEIMDEWFSNSQTKIVLEVKSEEQLVISQQELLLAGIKCVLIKDQGRTEIEPGSKTVLACEIVDKVKAKEHFKRFQLLK